MPAVYSDTLSHDAVLVWLTPPGRDVVGGVQMRTAPPPEVFETITVAESVRVQAGVTPVVEDSLTPTDAVEVQLPMAALAVDLGPPAEAVEGRLHVLLPSVGDDLGLGEVVTLALPLAGVSVDDTVATGESVLVRVGLIVHDDVPSTDFAAAALVPALLAVDLVGPTDAVEVALNVLTPAVGDAVGPADVVSLLAPIAIQVEDVTEVDERRNAATRKAKKIRIRGQGAGAG